MPPASTYHPTVFFSDGTLSAEVIPGFSSRTSLEEQGRGENFCFVSFLLQGGLSPTSQKLGVEGTPELTRMDQGSRMLVLGVPRPSLWENTGPQKGEGT